MKIKDQCNRSEFPLSQFFRGEILGRPILSPPSQFPPPLNIFKDHYTLFFLKKLESHFSIIDRTHAFWCFVVIWKVGKEWAGLVFPLKIFLISIYLFNLCYSFTFTGPFFPHPPLKCFDLSIYRLIFQFMSLFDCI